MSARLYKLTADNECIEKTATSGGQIKTPGIYRANLVLTQACRGGIDHVRRYGCHHNQVDLFRPKAFLLVLGDVL